MMMPIIEFEVTGGGEGGDDTFRDGDDDTGRLAALLDLPLPASWHTCRCA